MDITIYLLLGFIYGVLVGLFNHWLVIGLMKKIDTYEVNVGKRKLMFRYLLRYFIYALALFMVYKNTYVLIATGVGIIILSKIIVVKYTIMQKGGE